MKIAILIQKNHSQLAKIEDRLVELKKNYLMTSAIEKRQLYVVDSIVDDADGLSFSNLASELTQQQEYDFIYLLGVKNRIIYQHVSPYQIEEYLLNSSLNEILYSLQTLVEDIKFLKVTQLLDRESYQNKIHNAFANMEIARHHFLLIGRFIGFAELVYPYWLINKNQQLIDWKILVTKQRVKNKVSIVIPVYNQLKLTLNCLKSIEKYTIDNVPDIDYDVIVVNNGSEPYVKSILNGYAHFFKKVKIINNKENLNFSIGCNIGFANTDGEYVVFLNNDTLVTDGWLTALLIGIKQSKTIAVQPKLVFPDNSIQSAGINFSEEGFGESRLTGEDSDGEQANKSQDCPALTAACIMLHHRAFEKVQGFDPIYINGQEDIDLSLKLRQCYPTKQLWYCADSKVIHVTSQTDGRGKHIEQNRKVFAIRWHGNEHTPLESLTNLPSYTLLQKNSQQKYDAIFDIVDSAFMNHVIAIVEEAVTKTNTEISTESCNVMKDLFFTANTATRQGYKTLAQALYGYLYHQSQSFPNQDSLKIVEMVRFNLSILLSEQGELVNSTYLDRVIARYKPKKSWLNEVKKSVYANDYLLEPVNIDAHDGIVFSENNDPYFELQADFYAYKIGFYGLSFCLYAESSINGQFAKVYVDYGGGFIEEEIFGLNVQNGLNERVIYLHQKPVAIRLDPLEATGVFCLFDFELTTLHEDKLPEYFIKVCLDLNKPLGVDISLNLVEQYKHYNQAVQSPRVVNTYEYWIERNEEGEEPDLLKVKRLQEAFEKQFEGEPMFSVVIPTYNTEEKYLRACLDSVLSQSFADFEVCIADDCSSDTRVQEILREYQQADSRIKVVYRQENGHISQASNSALEICSGNYVVLVDHDDMLATDCLYYFAKEIKEHPNSRIIYSDEDFIDEDGQRANPHFKSDWNPDLLFTHNYVTHLCVYDRDLLKKIGGFKIGVEGSQDYDLLLRAQAEINPKKTGEEIRHITKILYHWRAIEGSTAKSSSAKSYTVEAGRKALTDYFSEYYSEYAHKGVQIENTDKGNFYRVIWPLPSRLDQPEKLSSVSLIIPTRDGKDITEQAVRSILDKTSYTNYDILIVDNGSEKKETLEFFERIQQEDSRVRVVRYDYPFNYAAINNFGVKHSDGEIIGLINNDVEVINSNWLTEMVRQAIRPDIGCVGAKLYYPDDTVQHGGVIIGLGGYAGHSHKHSPRDATGHFNRLQSVQNLSAVTGACLLIRRAIYNEVGGLDEKLFKVAYNDVDFCLKVKQAGYRNLWTPYAELYHHESISRGYEDSPEKVERFNREKANLLGKWGDTLKLDPYYSPNLTHAREDFSINDE